MTDLDDFETIAMSEDTGLDRLDRAELVTLWREVEAAKSVVASAHRKITDALAAILDTPEVLDDGRVLKAIPSAKRTAWRKPALRDAIVDVEGRWLVDPQTGDQIQALPIRSLGFFDPTTATTKLKAAGIDYRHFCTEEWTTTLTIIT